MCAACDMSAGCTMLVGESDTDESGSLSEESNDTDCAHATVRGISHYVGSTVKNSTEGRVCTFIEAEVVSEPCHCNFTTMLMMSAAVAL